MLNWILLIWIPFVISGSGSAYNIKCKLCEEKGINASYEGKIGDNLVWRQMLHAESVKGKVQSKPDN